ncbi:MAG: site-specific integrase [Mesorhizobium sp.]|uniref:tyrosine-type recombinase/integrase n=1 Tax=unclassified Mesorhizobium TaxID=325217 RepID=UPI000FCB6641|nr:MULTISPECIES: site-specific integrase [unclassified Mesorhizobium]RUV71007.1 site-specific integrase [Mesorhizobium sp. M5C.F.Cr.IN.023.01.1.1]RWF86716.1 MAG: site-specific integrase [Mesorhizobium sp.]RWF94087.1 MAG: site-specific integrase [Mesorhizobium sp.]RWH48079.1 MAG: site-specific integrase [Mesorhizobium sp.]RWI40793.1 MAG: site-specific integrase [Mesorhizobium sp.]
MVMVELKGLHTVKAKGKVYYYAWRGGPVVKGEPGTAAFQNAYNEAIASRAAPDGNKFSASIIRYRASPDYKKLAESTRRNWGPWLDRIADHFGSLSMRQFDRPEKIRPRIRAWRAKFAETPRAADYGMQVLSRVLSFEVDRGAIAANPCEGIKQLYSGSRSEIIWTDADIAQLKAVCSVEVAHAVDLAAHTGLRAGDLVRLAWSHVGEDAIIVTTGKSKHRREAVIPLYQELRDVLARIPRRSPVILTSSKRRPWVKDGLGSSFLKAKADAWPDGENLNFHDLRGTAATKFYIAGLTEREIAEIMGWEEEHVARIIRRYVSRTAALKERIRKLDQAKKRT